MRGVRHIRTIRGISEYRFLKNGLTILLKEDHGAPLVGVDVHYKVGSRHEKPGTTGSTHILEHMLFKGSRKFNKKSGKDFWNTLGNTGTRTNATTWMDRTHYYEIGPKELFPLFLEAEADRMRGALLDARDLATEMTVVRNEYERGENNPSQALDVLLWATAFTATGYHHSTIGWRSDIESATAEKLRAFYDIYYHPNNAVVTVIGDIDMQKALALVVKYFGRIPASPHTIPQPETTEPPQEGERRVTLRRAGGERIVSIGFKVPPGLHQDSVAVTALGAILASGKTSRLYRALVDSGKATAVYGFFAPLHDEHLCVLTAHMDPAADADEIERIMRTECAKIATDGVDAKELARYQRQELASQSLMRDGIAGTLHELTEWIATGDWTQLYTWGERFAALAPKDVRRVAQTYLTERTMTVAQFIPTTV